MGGPGWSQEVVIVPGVNLVYAAPGGVIHYIDEHGYAPSAEFVSAVLTSPDCGSPEYFESLRTANAGRHPPIESYAAYLERIRGNFGRG